MAQSQDGRHSEPEGLVQVRRLPILPEDTHSCEPMVLQREAESTHVLESDVR